MDIRGQSIEDRRFTRPEPAGLAEQAQRNRVFPLACIEMSLPCCEIFCVDAATAEATRRAIRHGRTTSSFPRHHRHATGRMCARIIAGWPPVPPPEKTGNNLSTYDHGFVAIRPFDRGLIPGFQSDRRTPYLASDLIPWVTAPSRDCRIGLDDYGYASRVNSYRWDRQA